MLLSIAALLAVGLAGAAEPAKGRSAVKAKPADPVMTRAELRECMGKQDRNRALASELAAERDKINADQAVLQKQGDELKEQLAAVDRTNAEAVTKYNEQATAREAAVEALLTRTTSFNGRVEAAQAGRTDYANTCGNRRYDERDEAAIKNGK